MRGGGGGCFWPSRNHTGGRGVGHRGAPLYRLVSFGRGFYSGLRILVRTKEQAPLWAGLVRLRGDIRLVAFLQSDNRS